MGTNMNFSFFYFLFSTNFTVSTALKKNESSVDGARWVPSKIHIILPLSFKPFFLRPVEGNEI